MFSTVRTKSKMPGLSQSSLNWHFRHNLSILFLLTVIFPVDLWGGKTSVDLGMQLIETFTKRRYDTLNQSDIDSMMSLVSQSLREGRSFHYMSKLHDAMERETKRLEAVEDGSSKDWLIQAFRPATYDETSISFTDCVVCNKSLLTTRCNVTRMELLVPLVHTDSKAEKKDDWIFVDVNGQRVNSSRGTMDISRAVIFDLSDILLKPDAALHDGVLRITVTKQPCRNVFTNRCMLYEYCNINSTILDRFREYSHKENKPHAHRDEDRQREINIDINERDTRESRMNGNMNSSEHKRKPAVSQKYVQKVAQGKQSLISSQKTTLVTPRAMNMYNLLTGNSSEHSNNTNAMTNISHTHENRSSRGVPSYRNAGLREPTAVFSPQIMETISSQATEQHQAQRKKRHLENPHFRDQTKQRNGACGNNIESIQGECKRRPFFVSFQRDMGRWDIIRPELKVDIGYCSSTCRQANLFSNVDDRLTAHAVIVNTMWGESPPVICSPRKMSSTSILRISDSRRSLTLENLSNAKVESCWCT